ncbi:J domain-containing protein [Afifella sp. H1R]|uniref:J domain-containing protein n=1 Tax=Afifella sp. H1R TaxID=2908841 RepID=UPI001F31021C|nr:J domain-containing protein [Afifella sp. H1R]MCF1502151.1 J domain-containing protein [Afifella sp. H1R]
MSVAAFPLTWPDHIDRASRREGGRFKTTLPNALKNVEDSIRRFASDSGKKVENLVISSNYSLGDRRPSDPGVAVWFWWDGMQVCIPVDRYLLIEHNLQAIHHVIEARRTELRHGTLALVRATFKGFQALPPPGQAESAKWWRILGVKEDATEAEIKAAYRHKAAELHPDRPGGSETAMAELNRARDEALRRSGHERD